MWIQPTLVFIAFLFVLPGWAMYARPAAGSQSNLRHSKKQQENMDNLDRDSPKGPDGKSLKGIHLLKHKGTKIFIKDGQDASQLDQIQALIDANKGVINQKVQQQQDAIYQQSKAAVDSLKAGAENLNPKPRKDEDGRLSIHQINSVLGLTDLFHEGDMALSPAQANERFGGAPSLFQRRYKRAAPYRDSQYPGTIWTDGVNWDFNSTLNAQGQNAVLAAIAFWQKNTCIRFYKVNSATATSSMYPIVIFFPGSGCWSPVGRQQWSSFQQVSIGAGCEYPNIAAHEIAHSLGVYHTQSRYDRDDNIYVDISNVQTSKAYNYDKETNLTNYNYGIAYDFRSVMHYGPEYFAINNSKPVMYTVNPAYQMSIGSEEMPTFADIAMLNLHYSCYDRCNSSGTFCYYGGYPNPNNCTVCQCPNGFGGKDCSLPEPPTNGLTCGGQLTATSSWQFLNVTNQVGNGQYFTMDSTNPSLCTYQIFAPTGSKVQFSVLYVGGNGYSDYQCYDGCYYGGVSIKGISDSWKPQGMRICCPSQYNQLMTTASNLLVVQPWNNYYYTDFSVQYKIA